MSVYNEELYLKDTIDSILNQTFKDFEFLIINDGSKDNTWNILEDYAKQDKRIILINNEVNLGVVRSINKGINISKGKYIAIMDSGDISHQDRLKKQVIFLDNNDGVYIVGTWVRWINEIGNIIGETKFPLTVDRINIFKTGGAVHPSIVIRRKLFEIIGLYNVHYNISLEFELYMRTMKKGLLIANLPEYLVDARKRSKGVTYSNLRTTQIHQFKIKLKYLRYFFNVSNVIYTTRSMLGCLLPTFLLRYLSIKYMTNGNRTRE